MTEPQTDLGAICLQDKAWQDIPPGRRIHPVDVYKCFDGCGIASSELVRISLDQIYGAWHPQEIGIQYEITR